MSASSPVTYLNLKDLLDDDLWKTSLASEFDKQTFKDLESTLDEERRVGQTIFPPKEDIFKALKLTPLDEVKVVIVGQDPYPGYGKATGLAFSVPHGMPVPPSLENIYKELDRDPEINGFKKPDHGNLEAWTKQGVLLLNSRLTVGDKKPHANIGWERFTDGIIKVVSEQCDHVVFMLLGKVAQEKEKHIVARHHRVIPTSHPSPLSYEATDKPFFGSGCFSECISVLKEYDESRTSFSDFFEGKPPIKLYTVE